MSWAFVRIVHFAGMNVSLLIVLLVVLAWAIYILIRLARVLVVGLLIVLLLVVAGHS